MNWLRKCSIALLLVTAALQVAAQPATQHAFLVQNSGWMEPFYADDDSQLKPLVGAIAPLVAGPEDSVSLAAFNQSAPPHQSPELLYSGPDARAVAAALAPLQIARKPSGAMADTDFREAVAATISGTFAARSGILWIFTNNRNSPGNDPDTAKRNREFYDLVHNDPSIARSIAFPLRMPVQGQHYEATGLMVYALAYGEPAAKRLERLVEDGTLARLFTSSPARLKPLDRDAMRIVPTGVRNSGNVQVSLAQDDRTLVFDIGASDVQTDITLQADLENLFFPYEIVSAQVSSTMRADGATLPVSVSARQIEKLAPGAALAVSLAIPIPRDQVPSPWSIAALSAMGKRVSVPATIDITLDGQELRVSDGFRDTLGRLFPGDPMSDVFVPPATIQASKVSIPIVMRVQYPLLPVVLLVSGTLLLVACVAVLALLAGRRARFPIIVDGHARTVALKAFATLEVRDPHGILAGTIRRGLGQPKVVEVVEGHTLTIGKR